MAEAAAPIELQFCQKCGISIPLSDIETSKARPAPGGFICPGCVLEERPAPPAAAAGTPGALRGLALLLGLYLVGATTFLLMRELRREPVVLPKGVDPEQVEALDGKIGQLDLRMRDEAGVRSGSMETLGANLARLSRDLESIRSLAAERDGEGRRRDDELREGLLRLRDETVALKAPLSQVLEELRRLSGDVGSLAQKPAGDAAPPAPPAPSAPSKSREQLEHERQVQQYVDVLANPRSKDQDRYNAAYQLGDLQDPVAVDPLLRSLESDPYDMVRRAAAWALGKLGKHAVKAIPALIDKIGKPEEYVAYMCECALRDITRAVTGAGQSFGCDPTMPQKKRKEIQKQWEEWWEKNRSTFLP